jgi:hypothetical protein
MPIIYTYPKVTPAAADLIVISDVSATNPTKATRQCSVGDIVNLVTALVPGGGTTTSVGLSGGTTGITIADTGENPIITAGTFTLGGVLVAANGGTGHASYAIGDILYASGATTLSQLTFASAPIGDGDVLTLAGGVPSWATPTTGTMSSWTLIGDSGSQTITDGNTVDIEGGTDITTAAVATDKVTVTHDDNARTETPVTPAQLAHGATFDAITSVTTTATGHFTADTLTTYRLPAAGAGTVTSVGATNAMGVSSGITFVTNPVPITGAGTVDLSFSGAIGDMWFASTASELKLLNIGTSTSTPTGSVINQVLAVDASDPINPIPGWTTKEITIQDENVDIETATTLIDFTGAGVTATNTGAGLVKVNIPGGGGGGVTEGFGTFVPCLVTQGVNGGGTLEELIAKTGTMTYVEQFGRWYIINKQIYFDFQIAFTLGPEPSSTAVIDTLGVSAYNAAGATPEDKVLGLENIDALLANLNLTKNHNAGVDICDVYSFGGPDPVIKGWDHMPQGGKLNKFYGDGITSNKSIAWLHWLAQPVPGGNMSTQYDVPVADGTWVNMDSDSENTRTFYIAGSLNPIIHQED